MDHTAHLVMEVLEGKIQHLIVIVKLDIMKFLMMLEIVVNVFINVLLVLIIHHVMLVQDQILFYLRVIVYLNFLKILIKNVKLVNKNVLPALMKMNVHHVLVLED